MQQMRPFNPYVEDIDMYLEEAKERGLHIPNQEKLKKYAALVNKHNLEIVNRDQKAIEENTLKKKLEQDKIKEEKRKKDEKRINHLYDYLGYLKRFDKKYKKGQYDSTYNKPSPPPYHGWEPRIFSTNGVEVQPHFQENNFSFSNFDIVVDTVSKTHFPSNFPPIHSIWNDDSQSNDITQVKFDINDPYFSSLANAYKVFCLTGFSQEHLNYSDPFVKSLSNYFVYYWMSILQRKPYSPSKKIIDYLKKNHPIKKIWEKKFHQGIETPSYWLHRQPEWKTGRIRNAKPVYAQDRHFGQVGISYDRVTRVEPRGVDDWKDLIPKTSKGFTQLGQKMFQQSLESFCFCILDAQAKTGWSITEQGAKSFQTQDVFGKLVQDTIMQNDVTVTIANMKKAMIDTGVSRNFALIPNTILIPSDMRLQKKIPGFNNILTLVNPKYMHFGENKNVNPKERNPVKDPIGSFDHGKDLSGGQEKGILHSKEDDIGKEGDDNLYSGQQQKGNNLFYSGKKDNMEKSKTEIETTIIGGVAVGLILRLVLLIF